MWTKANAQGVAVFRISYCDTSDKATRSTCADRHHHPRPPGTRHHDDQRYALCDRRYLLAVLKPAEPYKAQGFPGDYIISHGADGKPFTKTQQVHMCENSVSPPPVAALARANDPWRASNYDAEAA